MITFQQFLEEAKKKSKEPKPLFSMTSGNVPTNAEPYIKELIENTESTKLCVCALI